MHQIVKIFKLLTPLILLLLAGLSWGSMTPKSKLLSYDTLPVNDRIKKSLGDEPFVKSEIFSWEENKKEFQKLDFFIAGLHKKTCSFALVKLSQYERYQEFVDFIKISKYDDKTGRIWLKLSHSLLPFNMILDFHLARIKEKGVTHFRFDSGFLNGLTGEIHVNEYKARCLFATRANWQGPDSGIPDTVFSFFSRALGKLSMEKLFRISQTL